MIASARNFLLGAVLCLVAAVAILLALEGGARLFLGDMLAKERTALSVIRERIWEEPAFFIAASRQDGRTWYETAPWHPRHSSDGLAQMQRFAMPKRAGAFRIFCVGESSVEGTPYHGEPEKAFPGRLERYLRGFYDGVEVINAGKGATSSGQIAQRIRELSNYAPDLIVLYAGHNEYGYYYWRPGVLRVSPFRLHADLALGKSYLYRLLLKLFHRGLTPAAGKTWRKYQGNDLRRWDSIPEKEWERFANNELFMCEKTFMFHLAEMAALLRRKKIALAVCTLVSNLKDFPPMFSFHSSRLAAGDLGRFNALRARAFQALQQRKYQDALDAMSEAVKIDGGFAETHYMMGQAYSALGDYRSARDQFLLAKDHSSAYAPYQRAMSSLNFLIKDFCRDHGLMLIDVENGFFRAPEGHGVPGRELLCDNIHPNVRGYELIARIIGDAIIASGIIERTCPQMRRLPLAQEHRVPPAPPVSADRGAERSPVRS